jgi:exodeoxyribonuclease VII small subunit
MPRPKKNEPTTGREIGPNTSPETMTFEDAFRRLEETAEALEAGGLPLAQAAAIYEQGIALVQRCNLLLNQTELKISQLKDSFSGGNAEEAMPVGNGLAPSPTPTVRHWR